MRFAGESPSKEADIYYRSDFDLSDATLSITAKDPVDYSLQGCSLISIIPAAGAGSRNNQTLVEKGAPKKIKVKLSPEKRGGEVTILPTLGSQSKDMCEYWMVTGG
jgi:hypothetical protein